MGEAAQGIRSRDGGAGRKKGSGSLSSSLSYLPIDLPNHRSIDGTRGSRLLLLELEGEMDCEEMRVGEGSHDSANFQRVRDLLPTHCLGPGGARRKTSAQPSRLKHHSGSTVLTRLTGGALTTRSLCCGKWNSVNPVLDHTAEPEP